VACCALRSLCSDALLPDNLRLNSLAGSPAFKIVKAFGGRLPTHLNLLQLKGCSVHQGLLTKVTPLMTTLVQLRNSSMAGLQR
jgi:hypothetical protein